MEQNYKELYEINKNVRCLKCNGHGAVKSYGKWYPHGLGDSKDLHPVYEKYRFSPHMSETCGFGGTIPWFCMNCGNTGLIDFGGLEGFKLAFERI